MVWRRGCRLKMPIAAMRPWRMPTWPEYQGEPVPSMMRPFSITMSNGCASARTAIELDAIWASSDPILNRAEQTAIAMRMSASGEFEFKQRVRGCGCMLTRSACRDDFAPGEREEWLAKPDGASSARSMDACVVRYVC